MQSGALKTHVRNFTLPPRAGIGNVYELFLIEKRAEEMVSAEKTWAPQVSLPGPQPGAGVGALQELAGVFC